MAIAASGAHMVTTARGSTRGLPAASTVLGGTVLSLIGLTWDVQWHTDVGPDTFFTLPHLFLYSGSAVSGLTSLIVVLATTAATRRGRAVDTRVGGRSVGVFKTFNAPAGYLVSGVGAAAFLLYGLWDQWWHGLYGFDAVINSPPHIGLLLSVSVTMIGTVMVFAAARHERWGLIGALASLGVLLAFSMVTVIGLQNLEGGVVDAITTGSAFLSVLLVLIGAGLRGRPGGALGVAATLAVIQAVFWWFSPWATQAYADAVGLPMRDYASTVPQMPALMPMCLIAVAALVELGLWTARSRTLPIGAVSLVTGGLAGLLVALCSPLQTAWVFSTGMPDSATVIATTAVGAVLGALAGFLGHRFGESLRLLAPTTEGNHRA